MAQLLLIGTGLIGGSFAMASRESGSFDRVVGYDRNTEALMRAAERGIVDDVSMSFPRGFDGVDAAFLAVHPSSVADVLARLLDAGLAPTVPTFDAASVKGSVIDKIAARLGNVPRSFVGCHPMAGAELKGPDAASATLFDGCRVFVTPQSGTLTSAVERVSAWWRACGATVVTTTPEAHDARVALTSHLPHLFAFLYARGIADRWHAELPAYTGPGFRDFTRIARADPELWRQIIEGNATAVLDAFETTLGHARRFVELVRAGRFDDLERELELAQSALLRFDAGVAEEGPREPEEEMNEPDENPHG